MFPAGIAGVETRFVTLANGIRIRLALQGDPAAPPVLLLHGWGACMYSYSEMLSPLARAGFRAVAMDFPGFGLSDKPLDNANYTFAALGDAALEVAGLLGLKTYALVGHSMGAGVALDVVMRPSHSVSAAVLIGAVGLGRVPGMSLLKLLSPGVVDRFTPAMVTRALVSTILRVAFAVPGRPRDSDVEEYWAPSQFDEYAIACRACLHEGHWHHLSDDALQSLRVPVLAIWGGRDRFVRSGVTRSHRIPGARVVEIPDGGHLMLQECAPRVNDEVVRFLQAIPGK